MSFPEFSSVNPDKSVRGFSDLPPPYSHSRSSGLKSFPDSSIEPSFLERKEFQETTVESSDTSSANFFSTVGNIIAWPFVKIYELFACIFNTICCCCCKSNIVDRGISDPKSVLLELRKSPTSVAEEAIDLLINNPQAIVKSLSQLFEDSPENLQAFQQKVKTAKDELTTELGAKVVGKLIDNAFEVLNCPEEYQDIELFILENKYEYPSEESYKEALTAKFGQERLDAYKKATDESNQIDIKAFIENELFTKFIVNFLTKLCGADQAPSKEEALNLLKAKDDSAKEFVGKLLSNPRHAKLISPQIMLDPVKFFEGTESDQLVEIIRNALSETVTDLKPKLTKHKFYERICCKFEEALKDQGKTKEIISSLAKIFQMFSKMGD